MFDRVILEAPFTPPVSGLIAETMSRLDADGARGGLRLIALPPVGDRPRLGVRGRSPLPKWRLKRVVEHVEAHLSNRVTLADMAGTAGLTRMHFAAQFRLATGMRPHEYVLRRRIEHAQRLLCQSNRTLVDIALSVGFQTQAHFTTVFKRFVGETPRRWRQASLMITDLAA